ncbi:MAG: hypothetical protein Q4P15_01315 [Propionibacteriaceae bacterium]|nr:hypothetical protein [Propionibacteriaceae bacterium]
MASSTRSPATIGALIAAAFIAAAIVVWFTAPNLDASFGWFAYAPLSDDFSMGAFILHGRRLIAAGLAVLGAIIGAVALGFHWGRGVGRSETPRGPDPFSHPFAQ